MNFCTVDIPNKTLTILEEKDGLELLSALRDLWISQPNQHFPLDHWIPGSVNNHLEPIIEYKNVAVPMPPLFMCETEAWRVVGSENIQNVSWVDWKNG